MVVVVVAMAATGFWRLPSFQDGDEQWIHPPRDPISAISGHRIPALVSAGRPRASTQAFRPAKNAARERSNGKEEGCKELRDRPAAEKPIAA